MGVSKILNRWLNRFYKSIAIFLVLLAVLISGFRLLLPYAHHYTDNLTDYINQSFNGNVVIGSMSLGWQQFGPTLIARDIHFLETQTTNIFIDNIDIHVDFWRTVTEQELIARHISLNGVQATIDKTVDVAAEEEADEAALVDDALELFLNQIKQFSLINSQVVIKQATRDREFFITKLNWQNKGLRHQASGEVKIAGVSSNYLKLLLDLYGENRHEMSGQVYLQAKELNITPWLDRVLAIPNEKTHSDINFDAWLSITNGTANQLHVALGENTISWLYQQQTQQFSVASGQLAFSSSANQLGYVFNSSPLNIKFNEQLWEPLSIAVTTEDDQVLARVSSLDIGSFANILPLIYRNQQLEDLLRDTAPVGQINNIFLEQHDESFRVAADLANVSMEYSKGVPGIKNLSGHAIFADNNLHLELLATDGALDFDKHFIKPIPYNSISTVIDAQFTDNGMSFDIPSLKISSNELKVATELNISIPKEGDATMSLLSSISELNVENLNHYYPHLLMGDNLVDYLNSSIQSGVASHAQVLFHGPLANFPFNDHSGIFVVDAELTNSVFSFDSNWPAINNFNANLNFTNNSMLITGRSGELTGLDVKGVTAGIDQLKGSKILNVDAYFIQAEPQNIGALMQASPLANSVGETLKQLAIKQPINGDFNLSLPLAASKDVVASGNIYLKNNEINLQTPAMEFTEVNGHLYFRNDVVSVEQLSLNWLDLPLSLDINARQQEYVYQTDISIDALWPEEKWSEHVADLLKPYQHGTLSWQGKLSLFNHRDGVFTYKFQANSAIEQLTLNLPAPYKKAKGQKQALLIDVAGDVYQSRLKLSLAEQLNFSGLLNHEKVHFDRAHLALGQESMLLPMDGFHITTALNDAVVMEWQPYISDILDTIKNAQQDQDNDKPLFPTPKRIRGTVTQLDVLGEQLNNVSFNFIDQQQHWLLQLNALETRSQIKLYPDWLTQGLAINAEFLHLTRASVGKSSLPITGNREQLTTNQAEAADDAVIFNNFPALSFHCDHCSIGKLDLGTLDLSAGRVDKETIKISNFKAVRDKSLLTFDLFWKYNQKGSSTRLIGELSVDDIERELNRFDFDSIAKESGFKSNYSLGWQGTPYQFASEKMNGEITFDVDDGYLAEVGDAARIFSVLSLESLVRKLTLDFRDIFSDGMFYSSIEGDFKVSQGTLYTNNTNMYGAAGDLVMKGNTNLATGALDYSLSYKPNLTSSLPVLAWVATLQPTIFLATIAIDQVITSQVVSEFTFELTGTIDEPNFKEVDRKTEDISVGKSIPPKIIDKNEQPIVPVQDLKQKDLPANDDNPEEKPLAPVVETSNKV